MSGGVSLRVSEDQMQALLTLVPQVVGPPATVETVMQELARLGVKSGILPETIAQAVNLGEVKDCVIARGKPAQSGEDARFESLIPELKAKIPAIDEKGIADYRNLGKVVDVKPGDPVMRRTPPTNGVHGEDVLGRVIPPTAGKDTPFAGGLKGVKRDDHDPNLLVATIGGQPIGVPCGICVDPVMKLPGVDLASGNVNFQGTLVIEGGVAAGMEIKASGDILINGLVEAAVLEADGDITVKGGIVGRANDGSSKSATAVSARIKAKGSVMARFIENAQIEAGNSIIIDEQVLQSELTAVNQVVVGKKGARRGHLIGGSTRATLLVHAQVFGSPAGIKTHVMVGVNPFLYQRLEEIRTARQKKAGGLEDINKIISYLGGDQARTRTAMYAQALEEVEALRSDLAVLEQEFAFVQAQIKFADSARIVAGQQIFAGTRFQIGTVFRDMDEGPAGTFTLNELVPSQ